MFIVISTLVKFVLIPLLFTLLLATVLTLLERRQSAYSQDRVGPNRAHFMKIGGRPMNLFGMLHPIADALKMFTKEWAEPNVADKWIFRLAPMLGFSITVIIMALIPFGPDISTQWGDMPMQVVRTDAGVLLIFAISSLGIYGTVLAGWASNNRFALMGGMRAAAQAVSYEITIGLTLVGAMVLYGTVGLNSMVEAQSGLIYGFLPNWGFFYQPLGAVLFFVAAMAETKRAPFDMPEGESEIIGYFLEYSSMGFGLFMLGEFAEIVALSALFATVFLGGWQLPWILGTGSVDFGFFATSNPWVFGFVGMLVFMTKVFFLSALQLQLRWSLPRFRYDQVMRLCWKQLLPLSLVNIFLTAFLVWWDPSLNLLKHFGVALIIIFIMVVIAGPKRRPLPVASH